MIMSRWTKKIKSITISNNVVCHKTVGFLDWKEITACNCDDTVIHELHGCPHLRTFLPAMLAELERQ